MAIKSKLLKAPLIKLDSDSLKAEVMKKAALKSSLFTSDSSEKLINIDISNLTNLEAYDRDGKLNQVFESSKKIGDVLYKRFDGNEDILKGLDSLKSLAADGINFAKSLEAGFDDISNNVKGYVNQLNDVASDIKGKVDSVKSTVEDGVQNAVAGITGNFTAAVGNIGGNLMDKAKQMAMINPDSLNFVQDATSEIIRVIDGNPKDITSYGNLVDMLGNLTGMPIIKDIVKIGYESALIGAAFSELIRSGDHDSYESYRDNVSPHVYAQAVLYSIPSVAHTGELSALETLLRNTTPKDILAHHPEFIKIFMVNFKSPRNTEVADLKSYVNDVVAQLNRIDPNWYRYKLADGTYINDLTPFTNLSGSGYEIFCLHDQLGYLAQLAPEHKEIPVESVIRSQFPLAVSI